MLEIQKTHFGHAAHPARCTRRYGRPCRDHSCPVCGRRRISDWDRILRATATAYGGLVLPLTITAPGEHGRRTGEDRLPWDPRACAHRGPHRHRGEEGCRVSRAAVHAWTGTLGDRYTRLWKAAMSACRRARLRPVLLFRRWELQSRGAPHVHIVLGAKSPGELRAARKFAFELARLAGRYGFGSVDVTRLTEAEAAAAYCCKRPDERLQNEQFLPSHSCRAAQVSGLTISLLRRVRVLWAVRRGLIPPPSWDVMQLATVIAAAGPWTPGRGP